MLICFHFKGETKVKHYFFFFFCETLLYGDLPNIQPVTCLNYSYLNKG